MTYDIPSAMAKKRDEVCSGTFRLSNQRCFDACAQELIPIIRDLMTALKKYETQSCNVQMIDMAAKIALNNAKEKLG